MGNFLLVNLSKTLQHTNHCMLPQPHKSCLKVCLVAQVIPFSSLTQKMITCCTVKQNQLCSKLLQIHTALSHQARSIVTPVTAEFTVRSAIS